MCRQKEILSKFSILYIRHNRPYEGFCLKSFLYGEKMKRSKRFEVFSVYIINKTISLVEMFKN